MKPVNLHLCPLDLPYISGFMDFVGRNFRPDVHCFILLRRPGLSRHVRPGYENVLALEPSGAGREKIFRLMDSARRVFIHALVEPALSLAAEYPGPAEIHWMVWGGEVAAHLPRHMYDAAAEAFYYKMRAQNPLTNRCPLNPLNLWRKWRGRRERAAWLKAVARMDYFLGGQWLYNQVAAHFPLKARRRDFLYYVPQPGEGTELPPIPEEYDFRRFEGFEKIIQVGHSGNLDNNHHSVIEALAALGRRDFGVLVPLAYGHPPVIDELRRFGREKLGGRFLPLTAMLPPDQYAAVLGQVDAFICNSWHAVAFGNIRLLFSLGKKIYLNPVNEESVEAFAEAGLSTFLWDRDADGLFEPLAAEEAERNRRLARAAYGEENTARLFRRILEEI